MKPNKVFLTLSLLAAATGMANPRGVIVKTLPEQEAQIEVSQVQAFFTLKKPTEASQTRINLMVKDNGGSTDVSPKMALYLTFWQDGEMGDTTASFLVGDVFQLEDYKVLREGVLELKVKVMNFSSGFVSETWTIDFNAFASKFEREASMGGEDFVTKRIRGQLNIQGKSGNDY